jgi:hypothetical protein
MLHVLQRLDARMERCLGIGIHSRSTPRGGWKTVQAHLFLRGGGNVGELYFDENGVLTVMIDFTWFQLLPYSENEYIVDEVYEVLCSRHHSNQTVVESPNEYIVLSDLDMINMRCRIRLSCSVQQRPSLIPMTELVQTRDDRARNIERTFADIWSQSEEVVSKLNKKCDGWRGYDLHPVMVDVRDLIAPFVSRLSKRGYVRKDDPILARERRRFVMAGKCFMYDKLFDVMQCLKALGGNVNILNDLNTLNETRFELITDVVDYVLPPPPTAPGGV